MRAPMIRSPAGARTGVCASAESRTAEGAARPAVACVFRGSHVRSNPSLRGTRRYKAYAFESLPIGHVILGELLVIGIETLRRRMRIGGSIPGALRSGPRRPRLGPQPFPRRGGGSKPPRKIASAWVEMQRPSQELNMLLCDPRRAPGEVTSCGSCSAGRQVVGSQWGIEPQTAAGAAAALSMAEPPDEGGALDTRGGPASRPWIPLSCIIELVVPFDIEKRRGRRLSSAESHARDRSLPMCAAPARTGLFPYSTQATLDAVLR
jgi:hypothetical protein